MNNQVKKKARKIRMLILDVDGVLTDGRIIYDGSDNEFKNFNVQDGFGMVLLHRAGINSGIITAKGSGALVKRAKEMEITNLYQNISDKLKTYNRILKRFGLKDKEICYIGDDLMDLPVLNRVGLAVSVADGVSEVKKKAHYITGKKGGRGAVREVVEIILKAQGKWAGVTDKYRG